MNSENTLDIVFACISFTLFRRPIEISHSRTDLLCIRMCDSKQVSWREPCQSITPWFILMFSGVSTKEYSKCSDHLGFRQVSENSSNYVAIQGDNRKVTLAWWIQMKAWTCLFECQFLCSEITCFLKWLMNKHLDAYDASIRADLGVELLIHHSCVLTKVRCIPVWHGASPHRQLNNGRFTPWS